jgi:hypothetical protein
MIGIDIDAGCGQLKAELIRKRRPACSPTSTATDSTADSTSSGASPAVGSSAVPAAEAPRRSSGEILQESIQ